MPTIWDEYRAILKKHSPDNCEIEMIERFAFYECAKNAYCIVATSETAVYANILLKKGVVPGARKTVLSSFFAKLYTNL